MKKLILLAGVATLAACSEPAVEEAPAEDAAVEEAVAEDDGGPGTYDVNWPDGTTSQTVMHEDGTWTSADADGNPIGGTYALNDQDQMCFSMEGEEDQCWTDGETDADGWTTSTAGDGTVITYRRVDDA